MKYYLKADHKNGKGATFYYCPTKAGKWTPLYENRSIFSLSEIFFYYIISTENFESHRFTIKINE